MNDALPPMPMSRMLVMVVAQHDELAGTGPALFEAFVRACRTRLLAGPADAGLQVMAEAAQIPSGLYSPEAPDEEKALAVFATGVGTAVLLYQVGSDDLRAAASVALGVDPTKMVRRLAAQVSA